MMSHGCTQSKTVVLCAETESVTALQKLFRVLLLTQWAPARNIILHLAQKFEHDDILKEEKRPHLPSVLTPENNEAL
jgi:hypothetical protein